MLHQVPRSIKKAARRVVLRHPNAFDAILYRKEVTRTDPETLGGAMVLSQNDEPEFEYTEQGDARLVFSDEYMASTLSDSGSALNYAEAAFFALIEPVAEEDESGFFEPEKSDVLYLVIGEEVALAFEVTGVSATVGISGFGRRYELTKRDDLVYLGFAETQ